MRAGDLIVSVLMPVYNHERYVVAAIESVLAQAEDFPAQQMDIILVDDGSTDRTPELVAPYADRIRIIRKPNGGALSTVNRLLAEARGDVFTFLAGDDLFRPGRIAQQAAAMAARPDVTLLYGDCEIVDDDGRVTSPSYYGQHGLPRPVGDARGPLLEKNVICAPSIMLRTALRERVHPIGPPAVWEDWWMVFHAACAGDAMYLPGTSGAYRVHGANMSAGLDAAAQQRFVARELPFRRWLLTEPDHEGIPAGDVVSALAALEWHARSCAAAGLGSAEELLPVGPEERAAAGEALREAQAAADPARAVRLLARALAWNPGDVVARAELALARQRHALSAPPAGVRGTVVLGLAGELSRRPELLAAHAEAHGAADDVTLVIDARGWSAERIGDELVPHAAALGLDGEDGPDVLVIDDGRGWSGGASPSAILTADPGTAIALGAPMAPVAAHAALTRAA